MISWDDDDQQYSTLESLKQASASLCLHESASCACLLPCGLLPEELEELEALAGGGASVTATLAAPGLKVEAAVGAVAGLALAGACGPADAEDAPAPRTPTEAGSQRKPAAARMLAPSDDEEASEEEICDEMAAEEADDATPPAIPGAAAASGALAAAS